MAHVLLLLWNFDNGWSPRILFHCTCNCVPGVNCELIVVEVHILLVEDFFFHFPLEELFSAHKSICAATAALTTTVHCTTCSNCSCCFALLASQSARSTNHDFIYAAHYSSIWVPRQLTAVVVVWHISTHKSKYVPWVIYQGGANVEVGCKSSKSWKISSEPVCVRVVPQSLRWNHRGMGFSAVRTFDLERLSTGI